MFPGFGYKQLALRPDAPPQEPLSDSEKAKQTAVIKRTIDLTGPYIRYLENRFHCRNVLDARQMQPTAAGGLEVLPPLAYPHQPASSFTTKFVHISTNKNKSGINAVAWTPAGQRCITGANSGEFTLWSGSTFGFETIIQAHEKPIRAARFTRNGEFMISGDDAGIIKYWKPNLELVKENMAHQYAVRAIAFAPSDLVYATASDDSTVKVWDFKQCRLQNSLSGHGGDVKGLDWHPAKNLLASGGKDGLIVLYDPKQARTLGVLHGHNSTVSAVQWNVNGNWLLSGSRDGTCKVFDIRMEKELATFRGHSKDVMCAAWHPLHEELFVSGALDGSLLYWMISRSKAQAEVRGAHEGPIWSLAWHPVGHVLASGGHDTSTKFWCRQRPGDPWQDRRQSEQERTASAVGERPTNLQLPLLAASSGSQDVIPGIGEIGARFPLALGRPGSGGFEFGGDGRPRPPQPPPFPPPPAGRGFPQPPSAPYRGPGGRNGPGGGGPPPGPPPKGPDSGPGPRYKREWEAPALKPDDRDAPPPKRPSVGDVPGPPGLGAAAGARPIRPMVPRPMMSQVRQPPPPPPPQPYGAAPGVLPGGGYVAVPPAPPGAPAWTGGLPPPPVPGLGTGAQGAPGQLPGGGVPQAGAPTWQPQQPGPPQQ